MSGKNLTYHQFKQIAGIIGDKINNPKDVAEVAGLTEMDYDLLYSYLTKWNAEREASLNRTQNIEDASVSPKEESNSTPATDVNIGSLEKKSLMALFRSTLESSNDGIIIIDNNGKLIDWNDKFFEIAKIPKDALEQGSEEVGLEYIFNQVKDPQKLMIELGQLEEENSLKGDFGEVEFLDGRTIERYTQPLILDNKPVGRVWCFKDITEEKEQKNRVNILTTAIQSATQGILILDQDEVIYLNDYLRMVLNLENFDIKNNKISNIQNTNLSKIYKEICAKIFGNNENHHLLLIDSNKKERWFELSTFISEYNQKKYTLGIINDITKNKVLQEQLAYNAYHDLLTGMYNRTGVLNEIKQKISNKESFAVCYIDIDNFKLINESLGHHIGDMLLKKFGQNLDKIFNKHGRVGRLGGDEFVIIINNVNANNDVQMHIDSINDLISHPIDVKDYEFNITLTMGVALYPMDAATPVDLLKNADSAMYLKKSNGKNGVAFYDTTMKNKSMRKLSIANKIYKAIDNGELFLNYQPICDLITQSVSSVETLLRWNNKELGGFVPPDEFITITEEIGYIDVITNWVFENALQQLKIWHDNGYNKLRITINLSGALLYNPAMINNIYNILSNAQIDAQAITVELTESVFINGSGDISKMLNKMKDLGLKIAIDDFGTGYSSYAYLRNLPIDVIKIDKMFTESLSESVVSKQTKAIILSIVELGKQAGYDIVAEGVETIKQMNFLRDYGCKYGQGYYFSRPIGAVDMERLLQEDALKGRSK